ncbi:DUF1680 family protein [Streptomyces sp. Amel2xB2]|uniref:beta-L-arabinofuranosidase domain-containing protein n=1 Tax=Streptomyces sp. Amel2xB2 TaxID=1305829 RepID=UPI000DB9883F|nr:beta-L-arabinofuranosidase domain-containing protein [Streptomyces sp. Amel2xB2]RAJ68843.1 DUF1680 family protein [Streptomyces sp. Amel2xB2]
MPLSRRDVLLAGGALAGAGSRFAGLTTPASARARPARGGLHRPYPAPLAPTAFQRLPPGSIRAHGWLAGQLALQLDGLCGQYARVSHFLDFASSGWTHPENEGWEEVTYWLRGYVPLAIATGDRTALAESRRWIDAILATQQDDGFFGPARLRTQLDGGPDFWPYLPLMMALRTWEEYTHDARIVPFLGRFTRFMAAQGPTAFGTSWVSFRWGDGLDVAMWLYGRTRAKHLLTLCDLMHRHGADWSAEQPPTEHNVNLAQGFREPAQYALLSGDPSGTRAAYRNYERLTASYGQFPGGGFAGDENRREGFGDPRQGFETCGIVEFMASHELLTRITGDPLWADRCEELAFNSLPAALDPRGRAIHYITCANSVDLDDVTKTQGQFQNGFAMLAYHAGVDDYRCCPHNYGMGWPYLTEELWLATPDRGLAAAMYAPSTVTATVADGTAVTVHEETDYPFGETVTLRVSVPAPVAFPLRLRIPAWCEEPELHVAGRARQAPPGPAFTTVERTWSDGDTVELRLPQRTTVRTWEASGAVGVDRGPLSYALRIGERWEPFEGEGDPEVFPAHTVHATTPWNYGLSLEPDGTGRTDGVNGPGSGGVSAGGLRVRRTRGPGEVPANPFTPDGVPLRITAPARRIDAWRADDEHVVTPLRPGPVRGDGPEERVTLVPMGAARLRITAFPRVAPDGRAWRPEEPYRRVHNRHSGKVLAVDGMSLDVGGRAVQFADTGTGDHAWQLLVRDGTTGTRGEPDPHGTFVLRNGHSGRILGVRDGSDEDGAPVVQFAADASADEHAVLWRILGDPEDWLRIANVRTGRVLAVEGMSTADSAPVVQHTDTGTEDQLWRLG